MLELSSIKETVNQVAEAITAALDIETEIVDHKLEIIGGTGRYVKKIGSFEESGDLDSPYFYSDILRTGKEYVFTDIKGMDDNKFYHPIEDEYAEIACPIKMEDKIIGIIGLVAFNETQQQKIREKKENLLIFLRRMSDLICSKLIESQSNIRLSSMLKSMSDNQNQNTTFNQIYGNSNKIRQIKERALQVADSNSTILLTGESGTGKGLFVRAIHNASSRRDNLLVTVNCGAIPDTLLESELFGHEEGAFTGAAKTGKIGKFELADKGTIFLDEIGDLPLHLQVKLLDVLQNHRVTRVGGIHEIFTDVRVMAATNKDLNEMIEKKEFREDLYFRLNVIPMHIPPLRERTDDIDILLEKTLKRIANRMNKIIRGFTKESKALLCEYTWPGNIRELENCVEYAVNMEQTDRITAENLPENIKNKNNSHNDYSFGTLKERTEKFQTDVIEDCLNQTGRTLTGKREAAKKLGISEATLYRKIRE